MPLTPFLRVRTAAPVLLSALALGLTACGGDESASGDTIDPASAVPAAAPVYVEVVIRPEGARKAEIEGLVKKVARVDDPAKAITKLLDQAGEEGNGDGDDFDYEKDLKPWLGERVGIALTGVRGEDPDFVVIAQSKDKGKAEDAITDEKGVKELGKQAGVTIYQDTDEGDEETFAAVLDGAVLIGTQTAVKSAIDASKGSSLAGAKGLQEARKAVDSEALGFAYLNPQTGLDLLASSGGMPADQLKSFRDSIVPAGLRSAAAALDVEGDRIRIEAAAVGGAKDGLGKPEDALAAVPGGSLAALAIGDVEGQIDRAFAQFVKLGAGSGLPPGFDISSINGLVGFDVRKELFSWMGDAAVFVRGSGFEDIGGALVVRSKDPAASKRAIGRIQQLIRRFAPSDVVVRRSGSELDLQIPGLPFPAKIVADRDRFIFAVGATTLEALQGAAPTLGDEAEFKQAAETLEGGIRPSFYVDVPRIIGLVGAAAGNDQSVAEILPYLQAYGALVAGAKKDGDVSRGALSVRVK